MSINTSINATKIAFRVHIETYISEFCRAVEAMPRGEALLEQAHRNVHRDHDDETSGPTTWVAAESVDELADLIAAAKACNGLSFFDVTIGCETEGFEAWAGFCPVSWGRDKPNGFIRFPRVAVDGKLRDAIEHAQQTLARAIQ